MSSSTHETLAGTTAKVWATKQTLGDRWRAREDGEKFERGTLIGRYVVLSRLGAGAMGVVLAAYDPELDRRIALKLLRLRGADQEEARARLKREAQALAKLAHPNVVAVHDVGEHAGQLFVGMEFVEGQTLSDWLQAADGPPRSWQEISRVFIEAGRGLAAAHGSGLVHRDFKPDNVMIAADGRVRVMDFGLARAAMDGADGLLVTVEELETRPPVQLLDSQVTQTGALLGTPAYMSLERFEGAVADPRGDQFGFCVALYEALYGHRPFQGPTIGQLLLSVKEGTVPDPPRGSSVPTWLRKIVVRGLSNEPQARFASMEELLDAMTRDPAQRRRRLGIGAAVLLAIAGGAWGYSRASDGGSTCTGMEDNLVGVWDDDRRAEIEDAIAATNLSYTDGTWARVERGLDAYATEWISMRTRSCQATERGEQSTQMLDLRMACLDGRLAHLRATTDVLVEADPTIVKKAADAVASLPRLGRCADLDALRAEVEPPDDPEVRERVAELDEGLSRALALGLHGKSSEGHALTTALVDDATNLPYEPAQARAWLVHGRLQGREGDYEGAVVSLQKAYELAVAHEMTPEAARAASDSMFMLGSELSQVEEARRWAIHAEPLARAAGTDEARAMYLVSLGAVEVAQGQWDEAKKALEASATAWEAAYGPEHPRVGACLSNLGVVAARQGDHVQARAYYERAVAIREKALGPDHPDLAASLSNLGSLARSDGDYAGARAYLNRAVAVAEAAHGPDHPSLGYAINNLGSVALDEGKLKEAEAHYERALEIRIPTLGADHPNVGLALANLGNIAYEQGRFDRAVDYQRRSLSAIEKSVGGDHPVAAGTLTALALAELGRGDPVAAIESLERAIELRSVEGGDPVELAETRFALARALWEAPMRSGRDRARARGLAQNALEAYGQAGESAAKHHLRVGQWLADRG